MLLQAQIQRKSRKQWNTS